MMDKPVDHGCRHLVIREDAPPLGKLQVGCQKQALAFIAVGDDTEQELGAVAVNRDVAPFIKYQKVKAVQIAAEPLQCAVFPGFCQFEDKFGHSIEPHLIAFHTCTDADSDRHVGLADANRAVKDKVDLFLYEIDSFQLFTRQCRGKLYTSVRITFEGLIDWKTGPFDQPVAFVFFPAVYFLLQGGSQIFDLFRRAILFDQIRDRGSQEQGFAACQDAFFQFCTGSSCDHDAATPFLSSLEGRKVWSYIKRDGPGSGGVSIPYPVIRAARIAMSDLFTLLLSMAISRAFTAAW